MRSLIIRVSTWTLMAGLLFSGMGAWDIFKERNVSQAPAEMDIATVTDPGETLSYATIKGGRLDIANTYEYSLQTKKSDITLSTNYFIPVKGGENDSVVYILKTSDEPALEDMLKTANYSGLLQSKGELPTEILDAYKTEFAGVNFSYLDTTYKPETLIQKIEGLKIFLILLFGGLIIRLLATKRESKALNNTENPDIQDVT